MLRTLTTAASVVRLPDADVDTVAMALARDDREIAPVVARSITTPRTPGEFVRAAVEELERVVVELLPAWLPDAASVDRPDLSGVAATRRAAAAYASQAHLPPAFVTDLALLAVTGQRPAPPRLPVHTRVAALSRLAAQAFGRRRVVLLVPSGIDVTAGAAWLTQHGGPSVWITGPSRLTGGNSVSRSDGHPHPGSAIEQSLEAALTAQPWAAGRRWNHTYQPDPLTPPIRLDLVWPEDRCVVELDGPEHCRPEQFEADRQRDVRLQLDGYAVLRFTNARVAHDVGAVVHQIGRYLLGRRRERAEGRSHGRR